MHLKDLNESFNRKFESLLSENEHFDVYDKEVKEAGYTDKEIAKVISIADDYASKAQRHFITYDQMDEVADKMGLSQMSDPELRRAWSMYYDILSRESFRDGDMDNYHKYSDAASAFAEVINREARRRKEAGNYNPDINEFLKESLRKILNKLNEASMSDEDKRDSEIIRNLYKRIGGKKISKLTPEEEEVLNKYGLDAWGFRGDTKMITKGKNPMVKYGERNLDKINLADRARKTDSRDFGRQMRKGLYRTDINQEEREQQARKMQEPLNDFRRAKSDYKYAQERVDDYYNNLSDHIKSVDNSYRKMIKNAEDDYEDTNKYAKQGLEWANKDIEDILNKHRKKIEGLIERLNEASMSDEDKRDSEALRDILKKIETRPSSYLTKEERNLLNKYGLTKGGYELVGGEGEDQTFYSYYWKKDPKLNLADKIRKDRDPNRIRNKKIFYQNGDTFQDKEREYERVNGNPDLMRMKTALNARKRYQNDLSNSDAERQELINKATSERNDAIQRLTDPTIYNDLKADADKKKDKLNDLRRKHKLPTQESFRRKINESDEGERIIETFGNTPEVNEIIIDSIAGQLSDGAWEDDPSMEKYWHNIGYCHNGNIAVKNKDYSYSEYGGRRGRGKWIDNPFAKMSDDEIRRFFANKVKYIAQLDMSNSNENPYRGWRADNDFVSDYLSRGEDEIITIAQAYEFYKNNK